MSSLARDRLGCCSVAAVDPVVAASSRGIESVFSAFDAQSLLQRGQTGRPRPPHVGGSNCGDSFGRIRGRRPFSVLHFNHTTVNTSSMLLFFFVSPLVFVIHFVITIIQQFAAQDANRKRWGAQVQKKKKQYLCTRIH